MVTLVTKVGLAERNPGGLLYKFLLNMTLLFSLNRKKIFGVDSLFYPTRGCAISLKIVFLAIAL